MLASHLPSLLPRHWKGKQRVPAFGGGDAAGLPEPDWFVRLLRFAGPENLHLFAQWPVVPLTSGELCSGAAVPSLLSPPEAPLPFASRPALGNTPPVEILPLAEAEESNSVREQCAAARTNPVLTALQRLGCPLLHPAVAHLAPRTESFPAAAAAALGRLEVGADGLAGRTALSPQEAVSLFELLARGFGERQLDAAALPPLRRLAIFETRSGSFVPLQGTERFLCALTAAGDLPSDQLLRQEADGEGAALLRALGVETLDELALLERFVLPRFASLAPARRAEALDQIASQWPEIEQRPALVEQLRAQPLVDLHGSLLRADQLFDPDKALLASVPDLSLLPLALPRKVTCCGGTAGFQGRSGVPHWALRGAGVACNSPQARLAVVARRPDVPPVCTPRPTILRAGPRPGQTLPPCCALSLGSATRLGGRWIDCACRTFARSRWRGRESGEAKWCRWLESL